MLSKFSAWFMNQMLFINSNSLRFPSFQLSKCKLQTGIKSWNKSQDLLTQCAWHLQHTWMAWQRTWFPHLVWKSIHGTEGKTWKKQNKTDAFVAFTVNNTLPMSFKSIKPHFIQEKNTMLSLQHNSTYSTSCWFSCIQSFFSGTCIQFA